MYCRSGLLFYMVHQVICPIDSAQQYCAESIYFFRSNFFNATYYSMLKHLSALSFILLTSLSLKAVEKPLPYYVKKYNLPANVNVLSVYGEDCINCYYGFSFFLKSHEAYFKKKDFVFLFQKSAEHEIVNIFNYRLKLEKEGCNIIVDDEFYAQLDTKGVTTLSIIENKKLKEQFISKDIYKFKSFAGKGSEPATVILSEKDTIDLKSRFGTKKLSVAVLNASKIIIQNQYSNDIFLFNIHSKTIEGKLSIAAFTEKYDSLLKLLLTNDPENLNYNLENYRTNEFYKTYPLCKIKKINCVENTVCLGLAITRMVPDQSNHITYEAIQAIVKLDSNLQIKHVYNLLDTVPGVSGKYISLIDWNFLTADTAVFSLSAMGDRKKDSICCLYDLRTHATKILEMKYESFMPLKNKNGYYNYYHFNVWNDGDVLKGNFTKSPYVYNLSNNTKAGIPEIATSSKNFDLNGKDKYFWISKVFPHQGNVLMIAAIKQNEMCLFQYDPEFKKLISKKTILDGYLDDIFVMKSTVFAFENYSEKGDVAVLHIYELK